MTLEQLTANAKALSMDDIVGNVLQQHEKDIMEMQHKQLLEGKDNDGNDLTPSYTQDVQPQGYFKSRESAARYAAWKGTLNYPYQVQRNQDTPNLYINGRFFNELEVKFNQDSVAIMPRTTYAAAIVGKYGINSFGLSMQKWNQLFTERNLKTEVQQKFKEALWQN